MGCVTCADILANMAGEDGAEGWKQYLPYLLGALVVLGAYLLLRKRKG